VRWTHHTRSRIATGLDAIGLLGPAARLRERYVVMRTPDGPAVGPDGLPVPPPRLRLVVDGRSAGAEHFLRVGAQLARSVRDAVGASGASMEELDRVLDFGCGCGRVARHWAELEGPEVHGCDYNAELIAWCEDNLPFLRTARNALEPPTRYQDASFDLVYAFSVLTHLSEPLQHAWMGELRRILRPGGLLLITTLGESCRPRLTPPELRRFDTGQLVVERARHAGDNACTAYHPRAYVTERLLRGFTDVDLLDLGSPGMVLMQDAYLARRSADGSRGR
jgi:SAM-dependent methyltransferase